MKAFKIVFGTLIASMSMQFAKADNFNLTSNAIGNLIGLSNIEISGKISGLYTIGLRGTRGNATMGDFNIIGDSYGIIARRYFNEALANDAWFLGATADQENFLVKSSSDGAEYSARQNDVIVGVGGGYHWFWESFNLSLGSYGSNRQSAELLDSNRNRYKNNFGTNINLELNMGGKF